MMNSLVISSLLVSALLLASNVSFGQADGADTLLREDPNYVPPTSEPLYKAGKRGAPIDFGDQLQLGGMVSFGISKTPAEDGTTSTLAGGQLVYRSGVSSWSRFEAGVQFIAGTAGYDAADITVPYLLMARVGYGYAIGSNLYGTFGLGFGTAGGDFDGEIEGVEVSSDDLMTGVASNVEFALNLNPKGTFEFSGGLAYTVIEYALDSVNEFDGSIDKNITIQIPRMFVGVNINI